MGDRPRRDLRRDALLDAQGVTVIHVAANDLARDFDEAANAVVQMAAEKL